MKGSSIAAKRRKGHLGDVTILMSLVGSYALLEYIFDVGIITRVVGSSRHSIRVVDLSMVPVCLRPPSQMWGDDNVVSSKERAASETRSTSDRR